MISNPFIPHIPHTQLKLRLDIIHRCYSSKDSTSRYKYMVVFEIHHARKKRKKKSKLSSKYTKNLNARFFYRQNIFSVVIAFFNKQSQIDTLMGRNRAPTLADLLLHFF